MTYYPLELKDGYLIATIDGHDWLLDTGSPVSFGDVAQLGIASMEIPISREGLGLNAHELSGHLGYKVSGLLGVDVLNRFDMLFDLPQGQVGFSQEVQDSEGHDLDVEFFWGAPMVKAKLGGKQLRLVIDTGSSYTYLRQMPNDPGVSEGTVYDFHPAYGKFQSDTRRLDLRIADRAYSMRCGELPPELGMTLGVLNADGTLGNELFFDHTVLYQPRQGRLLCACKNPRRSYPVGTPNVKQEIFSPFWHHAMLAIE